MLSDILEVLAFVCFVLFAICIWPPAGLVVAGACLLFIGYGLSNTTGDKHVWNYARFGYASLRDWLKARKAKVVA